ncbi:MAG: hypothetical protein UY09_C0011G0009 [Parcubacteria group bacterium GW2011_GWA2_47_8]|nr:MAG: hypothetical protein UY09_C0011G0009 [Parcubacteria group bacterium GW2011_GWA2_47_8]
MVNGHSVTLIGLIPDKLYNFKVRSTDLAGNDAYGPSDTFQTAAQSLNPPQISNVQHSNVSANGATITWTTNEPTTSVVEYGPGNLSLVAGSFEMDYPTHTVELKNLDGGKTYQYRVRATNAAGIEAQSSTATFSTPADTSDITEPVISSIQVSSIGARRATITWITDEPSTSFVEWGTDSTYGNGIYGNEVMTINGHSVMLPDVLPPGQLIYFQVRSVNAAGLEGKKAGTPFPTLADTLDATPPTLQSGPEILEKTATTATIQWTTNESTNGYVGYSVNGQLPLYGSEQGSPVFEQTHTIQLVGLTPGTAYKYSLKFRDIAGNLGESINAAYTFDTLGVSTNPIQINDATIAVPDATLTYDSAVAIWDTDLLGDSFVEYGFKGQGLSSGKGSFDLTDEHSVTLTGLLSEVDYEFRVHSRGSDGVLDSSAVLYFTTKEAPDRKPPSIFDVKITAVTSNAISLTWQTDEPSIGQVQYSKDTTYNQSSPLESIYVTTPHGANIGGLEAGKTYHYRVYAKDAAGNESTTAVDGVFATEPETLTTPTGEQLTQSALNNLVSLETIDFDPPGISEVVVSGVTANTAIISWTTNEEGDSVVEYGTTTAAYTKTEAALTLGLKHAVPLQRLNASSTYYFRVSSADAAGNRGRSDEFNFTTLKGQNLTEAPEGETLDEELIRKLEELLGATPVAEGAPEISNIVVSSVTDSSALINWETNKVATSQVHYGFTSTYGLKTDENPDMIRDHWVQLSGLEPGVTYHFKVVSGDGQGAYGESSDRSFQTLLIGDASLPPILTTGPSVTDITSNSAVVMWVTDKPSISVVQFKPARSFLVNLVTKATQVGDFEKYTLQHLVELANLLPDTSYRYQIFSQTTNGSAFKSEEDVFRTKSVSEIYDVRIEGITYNSAKLTWRTGLPATTEVEYGETTNYGESVRKIAFDRQHETTLTNLTPDTLYHFILRGTDEKGNSISTTDFTFQTFGLPVIENKKLIEVNEETIRIEWLTDKETDTLVLITDEGGNQQSFGSPELRTAHSVNIPGLQGDKIYQYQIVAKDRFGQESSTQLFSFKTGKDVIPPVISQVRTDATIRQDGESIQAFISWLTDEPATSLIVYQNGLNELPDDITKAKSASDETLTTNHVILVSDFEPGSVYRFKVMSRDKNGNSAESRDFTILAPKKTGSIIDIIISNLEETFGFLKQLQQ